MLNIYTMVDSFGALDKWVGKLNAQAKGSIHTGYKAERLTFTGNATDVRSTGNGGLQQIAESTLNYKEYTDFSNGNISISDTNTHGAISGEGWFLVTDGMGNYFQTRDGEFNRDPSGVLMNQSGLVPVDQAMAVSLQASLPGSFVFNQPAMTLADVNNDDSGWRATAGNWLPYVAGSKYDEGGTDREQTVLFKRNFYLPNAPTGNILQMSANDLAFASVNGVMLSGFSDNASTGALNIDGMLKQGWNSIVVKGTEFTGANSVNFAGTVIGGVAVGNAGWAVKLAGGNPYVNGGQITNPPIPIPTRANAPAYPDRAIIGSAEAWEASGSLSDLILVAGPKDKSELQATLYGNTVFSWPKRPTIMPMELPGLGGTGGIVHNAIELANVNMQQLAPELAMAQQMYSNLRTILTLKRSNFDMLISVVK
ncbi:MAG: hypothetical protein H7338_09275 [Candidatus Sericytochromatia bacterium]|nr:hypothetical protein [Candidatus Sericytochromatia bacterium]